MSRQTRRQMPLFPLVTRPIPPRFIFDADAATRSPRIRRVRAMTRSVAWAQFCERNIRNWPDGP